MIPTPNGEVARWLRTDASVAALAGEDDWDDLRRHQCLPLF